MVDIIKKKDNAAKTNRYSYPTTDEQKFALDFLKEKGWDVNEMLRRFTAELISKGAKEFTSLSKRAG